jgi:hypothetical protein
MSWSLFQMFSGVLSRRSGVIDVFGAYCRFAIIVDVWINKSLLNELVLAS